MAEGWTRRLSHGSLNVMSTGIKAHGMNRRAIAVMAEAGVDISGHESTRITPAMLEQAYIVINVCGQRRQALSCAAS